MTPAQQMAALFGRERSVVAKHIGNAYREGELIPAATCAEFAQVQVEGSRTVSREVDRVVHRPPQPRPARVLAVLARVVAAANPSIANSSQMRQNALHLQRKGLLK